MSKTEEELKEFRTKRCNHEIIPPDWDHRKPFVCRFCGAVAKHPYED